MRKVAIVTGAAGDIGAAISRSLIERGYFVAGFDLRAEALGNIALSDGEASKFLPLAVDVRNFSDITSAVAKTVDAAGPVTVLVNNAGGVTSATIRSTDEAQWMQDIDLNLNGPWRCIKAVVEGMIDNNHGVIVNIASANARGVFGRPGYSAAKAGLLQLNRFAAVEFGRHGVRSVAICPGTVRNQAWKVREKQQPELSDNAKQWYPSRKLSSPEDIAKVVTFIADDSPDVMNGAVIDVDGGLSSGHDIIARSFTGESFN